MSTPVKISELTAASTLGGTEVVAGVQSGSTVKILISAIMTYVRTIFAATPVTVAEGGTNAATAAGARTSLGAAASGLATASGITMNTARLLGRTTAAAGAIEEISVGASLTLAAGSLSGTAASDTQAGVQENATQAEQETGTSTTLTVTPGKQMFHPSACKGWAYVTIVGGTVTLAASHNVSGVTDGGAGITTITWDTDFSSANYATVVTPESASEISISCYVSNKAAGSVIVRTTLAGTYTDNFSFSIIAFGDLV